MRIGRILLLGGAGVAAAGVATITLVPDDWFSRNLPTAPPPEPEIRWRNQVQVCVHENLDQEDTERAAMRDAITRAAETWNSVIGRRILVQFAGANRSCDASLAPDVPDVVEAVISDTPGAFAATDRLGNALGNGGRLTFRSTYDWNDPVCRQGGVAGPTQCRFADAVHEFGHLLGFRHDHVSANAPTCVNLSNTLETIDANMSYYDAQSVMNYCNGERWQGRLSEADICSSQVAYPPPGSSARPEEECYALAARTMPAEG